MTPRARVIVLLWGVLATARGYAHQPDEADHTATRPTPGYARTIARYAAPDVTLRNQDDQPVSLPALLAGRHGVALDFVFTSCSTICPVMTATFSRMQAALGSDDVRLVSISIDPDHDTPGALKAFAARFGIGSDWQLLTGDEAQVVRVLKAFDAYRGNKTNHEPLVFLRGPGRPDWVRISGFASAAELATEYRRLRAD